MNRISNDDNFLQFNSSFGELGKLFWLKADILSFSLYKYIKNQYYHPPPPQTIPSQNSLFNKQAYLQFSC